MSPRHAPPPMQKMAAACTFVATKLEECPKLVAQLLPIPSDACVMEYDGPMDGCMGDGI